MPDLVCTVFLMGSMAGTIIHLPSSRPHDLPFHRRNLTTAVTRMPNTMKPQCHRSMPRWTRWTLMACKRGVTWSYRGTRRILLCEIEEGRDGRRRIFCCHNCLGRRRVYLQQSSCHRRWSESRLRKRDGAAHSYYYYCHG